ncbi:hypothetical protein A2771_01625 [Candidatus Woesebacteria bacterium RIFCSPHIGHO2_01_FULL_38_26b]|uniref:Dockerin domain-containing protein n=1 Tax=Candidatus Woesebacteria bacterium RIFCSPHIGHO2_01_FULL_38_26b TaxID=1802491 RepID=A0A1F7Y437_9BACT|nr:MAG: hypothetical protein A2771_01625 [Candidatus Woesebacteria bacterium RIFCSPHIGHO2_01_FULL_38_26b]
MALSRIAKFIKRIPFGLILVIFLVTSIFVSTFMVRNSKNINKSLADTSNPIFWDSKNVFLSADDFYIIANGEEFYGKGDVKTVFVGGDPGSPTYTTLEVEWVENAFPMRLYIYFRSNGVNWWAFEIRTYNAQVRGDWLTYTNNAPYFTSPLNQEFQGDISFTSNDGKGQIYFKNLRLKAFNNQPSFNSDYNLRTLPGTEIKFPISDPNSGYGLSETLYGRDKAVISDQSDFTFLWSVENPNIVAINNISGFCFSGVNPPCPTNNHVDLKGVSAGNTRVNLEVKRISTGETIATTYWNVTISNWPPNSPSDVTFSQEANSLGDTIIVKLHWQDNATNENGFKFTWYIEGYGGNTIISTVDNDEISPIAVLPCEFTQTLRKARAAVYAYNSLATSSPAFGEGAITIPACPSEGDRRADINEDGVVDILDYVILFENFGRYFAPQ